LLTGQVTHRALVLVTLTMTPLNVRLGRHHDPLTMQLNYGLNDDVSLWGLLWVVPVFRDLWAISNRPPDCSGLQ